MQKEEVMPNKCDICGHETDYLERGYGEYKWLCKLCDDRNYRIATLTSMIKRLQDDKEVLILAIDEGVQLLGSNSDGQILDIFKRALTKIKKGDTT